MEKKETQFQPTRSVEMREERHIHIDLFLFFSSFLEGLEIYNYKNVQYLY